MGPNTGHSRTTEIKGWSLPSSTPKLLFCFLPSSCQAQLCVWERNLGIFYIEFIRFAAVKNFILWLTSEREDCFSTISCGALQLTAESWAGGMQHPPHCCANLDHFSSSNGEIAKSRPSVSILHKCLGRTYQLLTLFIFFLSLISEDKAKCPCRESSSGFIHLLMDWGKLSCGRGAKKIIIQLIWLSFRVRPICTGERHLQKMRFNLKHLRKQWQKFLKNIGHHLAGRQCCILIIAASKEKDQGKIHWWIRSGQLDQFKLGQAKQGFVS